MKFLKYRCKNIHEESIIDNKEIENVLQIRGIHKYSMCLMQQAKLDGWPIYTYGDGNCLYRATLLMLVGHEDRHIELRVRTLLEIYANVDYYNAILQQFVHLLPDGTTVNVVDDLQISEIIQRAATIGQFSTVVKNYVLYQM